MIVQNQLYSRIVTFLLFLGLAIGCKPTAQPTAAKTDDALNVTADESRDTETISVQPSGDNHSTSPSAQASAAETLDNSPEATCKEFMRLLQIGNRIGAENLLTRTALTATSRAGLVLEPMGGPNSTYQFGDVRYATNKQRLAQVDCSVIDQVDGNEYQIDMTWVVRKQMAGWRISGVMLELEPGQVKDFLSFENSRDVERMKKLAGVEEPIEPRVQATQTSAKLNQ